MSFVFPKRSCAGAFVHSAFSAPPVWDSLYILHDFWDRVKENEKVFSGMLFGVYDGVHFISELPASAAAAAAGSAAAAASSIGFILDSGASSDSMRENIV